MTPPVNEPPAPPSVAQWDAAAAQYTDYVDASFGRLRDELAWRNARPALPAIVDPANPPLILDAGCGPGHATARLLAAGYRVRAIDPSAAMLERARVRVAGLAPDVAARAAFAPVGLDALAAEETGQYDAMLCHNVLEFVGDPAGALRLLARALRPRGALSLLTLNRWSDLLRAATSGDPAAVVAALGRTALVETMTGGHRRLNDPDDIRRWLGEAGLRIEAVHGVRMVADAPPGTPYDALLAAELALAAGAPPAFAYVGRQVQFIARRAG